jgi:LacI family transcriptional regulator
LNYTINWLKSLPKPVGIFTWATESGREIIEACRIADIAVPFEVAVLGGDYDEILCVATSPALSGIVVPSERIGYEAAELLDSLMRDKGKASAGQEKPILIPPTGIVTNRSTDTVAISDPDLAQALRYLRDRAFESIQISDILQKVPVSRRSIERKFVKVLGRTPAEEIRRLRMARAKNLLANSSMSIEAIANSCGYGTYNYMSYVFTNECGMTPREYRKRLQGN